MATKFGTKWVNSTYVQDISEILAFN